MQHTGKKMENGINEMKPREMKESRLRTQAETCMRILSGTILGLAGPGVKIAGVMPCTVIRTGDMADEILNRDRHPEWNGERRRQ